MTPFIRNISAAGCAACLLAGCSMTPKQTSQCGACAAPMAMLPLSTYENFTPPPSVLKPLPNTEEIAPPPPETSLNIPSPEASAPTDSESAYDFFESARERRKTE